MSRGLEGQTRCGELKAELIAHGQHTVQRLLDISPQMWECLTVIAARHRRVARKRAGGGTRALLGRTNTLVTTETATFFTLPRSRIPPCWTGLRVVRLEISDVFRVRPLGPTRGSTRARKGSQAGACSESQAQEARLVRGVTIKTRHFNTCWLTRHDEDLDRPAVDRLRIRVHRRVRHSDEHQ